MTHRAIVAVVFLSGHRGGGSEEILLFLFSVICICEGVLSYSTNANFNSFPLCVIIRGMKRLLPVLMIVPLPPLARCLLNARD